MTDPVFQLSFPPITLFDWIITSLAGLALLSWLVFISFPEKEQSKLAERLPRPVWLWVIVGVIFLVLFVLSLAAAIAVLWATAKGEEFSVGLGLGGLIAAALGAPLIIWRTIVAQRQVETQRESLFNDKLNAAATDLAARRQVTRVVNEGSEEKPKLVVLTEMEDDLVTRAAAIARLADLVNEHHDQAGRVLRHLSAYMRGNFPAYTTSPTDALSVRTIPRIDKQAAIDAISEVHRIARVAHPGRWRLDLRRCDFDGVDFSKGYFFATDFSHSRFEAAIFREGNFDGALFFSCLLNYVDFFRAEMTGTRLDRCILNMPQPEPGGFVQSINMSVFRGVTFISSDISALDYLGTPEEIFGTMGNRETITSTKLSESIPSWENLSLANTHRMARPNEEPQGRSKAAVRAAVESGFENWSPYTTGDLATGHLLEKFFARLDMLRWPYWDT